MAPAMVWPASSGTFKVVQFVVQGKDYIRFGDTRHLHPEIVRSFADELRLKVEFRNGAPYPVGWEIAGAGYCSFLKSFAIFSGDSTTYGIGIDAVAIARIQPECKEVILSVA